MSVKHSRVIIVNVTGKNLRKCISQFEQVNKNMQISKSPIISGYEDFKLGGGALKKIAPSGGRRDNF
jgi:hypothetical protein